MIPGSKLNLCANKLNFLTSAKLHQAGHYPKQEVQRTPAPSPSIKCAPVTNKKAMHPFRMWSNHENFAGFRQAYMIWSKLID
jgi:hypothetical protein